MEQIHENKLIQQIVREGEKGKRNCERQTRKLHTKKKQNWVRNGLTHHKVVKGAKKELQGRLFDEGKQGGGKKCLQGSEKHKG